ncbi:MAG: hypothetical protein P8Y70_12430 [Candidatus Lokiarchaeota archaeon]
MSSPKEAEMIAFEYLEKNRYQKIELKTISDKIFKWEVRLFADSKEVSLDITKQGDVIGFFTVE